jgi:hypothetical protein
LLPTLIRLTRFNKKKKFRQETRQLTAATHLLGVLAVLVLSDDLDLSAVILAHVVDVQTVDVLVRLFSDLTPISETVFFRSPPPTLKRNKLGRFRVRCSKRMTL